MTAAPAPPVACRWLRTRSAYGRSADEATWESGDSPLESYWCLRTMEATGPDDGLVHAHACRPGRICFEARPTVAAVVLAAGRSVRLGRPKQLLVVAGEPLVRRAARAALEAGLSPVVVVTGAGGREVQTALGELPVEVAENASPEAGMAVSVRLGVARARALSPGLDAVALLACDQPLLDAAHLARLVDARRVSGRAIVASEYEGVRGVPVLLGAEVLEEVAALEGDAGAREVVRRDPARVAGVPFPGGALDVDREEDLVRAETTLKAPTDADSHGRRG